MSVHQRTGRFANAWSRFANVGSINGTSHKDLRVKFKQWEGDMPNDDYLNQMVPKNVCCKATVIACSSTYHWSFQTDQRRFSRHFAVLVDWKDFWVKGTYYESALKFQGKMVPMSQSESRMRCFLSCLFRASRFPNNDTRDKLCWVLQQGRWHINSSCLVVLMVFPRRTKCTFMRQDLLGFNR